MNRLSALLSCADLALSDEVGDLPWEERVRRRALVLWLVGGLAVTLFLLATDVAEGAPLGSMVPSLIDGAVLGGGLWWLRRGGGVHLPLHASLASAALAVSMLALHADGQYALWTPWWAVLPLMAMLVAGVRAGVAWTGIVFATTLGLAIAKAAGLGFAALAFPEHTLLAVTIPQAAALLLLMLIAVTYAALRQHEQERREALYARVRESEQRLATVFRYTNEYVCAVDAEGRVTAFNRALERKLAQRGQGIAIGESWLDVVRPEHRSEWSELLAQAGRGLPTERTLRRTSATGGQEAYLDVLLTPIRDGEEVVGVTVFGRDVTDQVRAREALRESNQRLIELSRKAGMAEAVDGVLHNVGNVMNSISVATEAVEQAVREQRPERLDRVATMLAEQEDLPAFFRDDPRAETLVSYLARLATHARRQREQALDRCATVARDVGHIRSILHSQQDRAAGRIEEVGVAELAEQALGFYGAGLDKYGIRVEHDSPELPPIRTDANKVLQILLNLLSNAKDALKGQRDAVIRVRTEAASGVVRVVVEDNGPGIAPEHRDQLFTHGFTTKERGHGFGLHASRLAAREMGGSLRSEEMDGPGARFVLDLPVESAEAGDDERRISAST